ncbi:MAG: peptidyl-prolyl cis-trans isomerase [Candidatus Omnitrophota bacterium]
MRKSSIFVFVISFVIMPALILTTSFAVEDAIIAVVGEELITINDLKDYISTVHMQLKLENNYSEARIREIMDSVQNEGINRLIEDRLILNAANEKGIEIKRTAIDEKVNAIRQKYPSENEFIKALTSQGLTLSDLRDRLADQMKAQYYIDLEFKSDIQINPREVNDYYEQNAQQFIRPAYVQVNSLFTPFGSDKEAAFQNAAKAHETLKSGKTFADTAKEFSSTASISTIIKGAMLPEIESKIFMLEENGLTEPLETGDGIFIFQVIKRFPQQTVSLNEAREQITQHLFSLKLKEKLQQWFKEAQEKTFIEIKNP